MTNPIFIAVCVATTFAFGIMIIFKDDEDEVRQLKFIRAALIVIVILLAMIVVRMPE